MTLLIILLRESYAACSYSMLLNGSNFGRKTQRWLKRFIHSFILKKKYRKVDEERTKSKIPHLNKYVEKGLLKEIETDIIKNNKIYISKIKTRY